MHGTIAITLSLFSSSLLDSETMCLSTLTSCRNYNCMDLIRWWFSTNSCTFQCFILAASCVTDEVTCSSLCRCFLWTLSNLCRAVFMHCQSCLQYANIWRARVVARPLEGMGFNSLYYAGPPEAICGWSGPQR